MVPTVVAMLGAGALGLSPIRRSGARRGSARPRCLLAEWLRGRTLYHVHALRAVAERGLPALASWLDHVAALGCGAVLLTPIHESSNHGYDTVDALRLDPRLGSDADLDRFVAECRARDVRVFFDGVFNHAGRAFRRPEWLSERTWEGHDELPTLDHDNPEVLSWAVEVACHWLDLGGDGWRFDVAYAMPRPFLRSLTTAVRTVRPDAFRWTGAKGDGDGADDEIRPALPESPPQHAATDQHRRWINFRRSRPWLTDAAIEVISKTNRRLQYHVADAVVTIDLDNGVQLDGFD